MNWFAALLLSATSPVTTSAPDIDCLKTCKISDAGYSLIRKFEGYSPVPYRDVAGKMTVGIGHLILPHEDFTQPLLPDAADRLLKSDAGKAQAGVNRQVNITLRQSQFDALASFTFNLGEGALKRSTLLKRVNAGRHAAVPIELNKWVYAGGMKIDGLIARRQEEGMLYAS